MAGMRKEIDAFINHRYTDLSIVSLILFSVALLVVETILPETSKYFLPVETTGYVLTGIFIVELGVRFYAIPSRRRFLRIYWIDIIAVMPIMRSFRILRVVRLLRLFRMGILLNRRLSGIGAVFRHGKSEIITVCVIVLIIVLAGAIGINLAERESGGAFSTIEGSIWWSLYSLMAGEPILGLPETRLGHVLTLLVMLGGLGFFATFTGIVSAAMVNRLSRKLEVKEMMLEDVRNHVVICGWNRMGNKILEEIQADPELSRKSVVVVAEQENPPPQTSIPAASFYFVSGDYTKVEILKESGIERAALAILLADKSLQRSDQDRDARTVLAALTIEKLNKNIFTCVELLNRDNQTHLTMAGVEEIVIPDEYAGRILATASRNRGIVALFDELLTSRYGNQIYKARTPADWLGKEIRWVHQTMKEQFNAVLLSIERRQDNSCSIVVNPAPDEKLLERDNLIFIATSFPKELGKEYTGTDSSKEC
ncbi:MAG: NAD-binding protein [Deltaproteobacteria bacterium]|nr:NAD-binding protein [Deltaproteobacteria bacterium]